MGGIEILRVSHTFANTVQFGEYLSITINAITILTAYNSGPILFLFCTMLALSYKIEKLIHSDSTGLFFQSSSILEEAAEVG